jgi:hypothetical protein
MSSHTVTSGFSAYEFGWGIIEIQLIIYMKILQNYLVRIRTKAFESWRMGSNPTQLFMLFIYFSLFCWGYFLAFTKVLTERSQINDLMLHLKLLEKLKQAKTKTSRREIIKIRVKINEVETENNIQRINETKNWFFKKNQKLKRRDNSKH